MSHVTLCDKSNHQLARMLQEAETLFNRLTHLTGSLRDRTTVHDLMGALRDELRQRRSTAPWDVALRDDVNMNFAE